MLYRSLTDQGQESVFLTAKSTAMVCWLFIGSWTFASVFSSWWPVMYRTFRAVDDLSLGSSWPWQPIILGLLAAGMVEILIIFVPIFLPMLDTGINPYFFAMLVALNLQTCSCSPPMAMSVHYLKGS